MLRQVRWLQSRTGDGMTNSPHNDAGRVSCSDQGLVFLVRDVANVPLELVPNFPVAFDPGGQGGGIGLAVAGDDVDDLDGLLALFVTVRRNCATWAAPSNSIQVGARMTLTVRRARRP
jgi:hypothetical protein